MSMLEGSGGHMPAERCRMRAVLRRHPAGELPGLVADTCHRIPVQAKGHQIRLTEYSFGSVQIDGLSYCHDLIINRGKIRSAKGCDQEVPRRLLAHPAVDRRTHATGGAEGWWSALAPRARSR